MSRRFLVALAVAVVLAGAPAAAGDSEKKCTMPLSVCLERMSSMLKTTGWVGIEYEDETITNGGYRVEKVLPGSPAEKAGLRPGDVLYALNGVRLTQSDREALAAARKEWKPGQSVTYTIKREGVDREITLTLAPMPADIMARWIGDHMKMHEAAERAAGK